ncbi:hypothetical protein XENTR_v10000125 [Xenopus tropicalis]|nr:hypothetical protein XENTR_v10000125 [Xenopus tropicalis]
MEDWHAANQISMPLVRLYRKPRDEKISSFSPVRPWLCLPPDLEQCRSEVPAAAEQWAPPQRDQSCTHHCRQDEPGGEGPSWTGPAWAFIILCI